MDEECFEEEAPTDDEALEVEDRASASTDIPPAALFSLEGGGKPHGSVADQLEGREQEQAKLCKPEANRSMTATSLCNSHA